MRKLGYALATALAVAAFTVPAAASATPAGTTPPVLAPMSPSSWDSTHPNHNSCLMQGQRLVGFNPKVTYACFFVGSPPAWQLWVNGR